MGVCPQCGTRTLPQQNFCRRCGTDLRGFPSGWRREEGPPGLGGSASRIQILGDVVHDALSGGIHQIKEMLHDLHTGDRIAALRRMGLWFFWGGLAALLGWANGLILLAAGIGLMAYARGFFRTKSAGPSAVTGETRWEATRLGTPTPSSTAEEIFSAPPADPEPATRRIPDSVRRDKGLE